VVNTETRRRPSTRVVRILDLGCGDGRLLSYLATNLPLLQPGVRFELYGLDVDDSDVQERGFLDRARALLRERVPSEDWDARLIALSTTDVWPFADDFFDAIVSNQVFEHIADHAFVLRQIARTLRTGGYSVHLFPLAHYVYEGHLLLPFVHRIRDFDLQRAYIRTLSRLGLGKFAGHRRTTGVSLEEFSERHADYMHFQTNYLTYREAMTLAKRARLRGSLRYTQEFYGAKMRSLLKRAPRYEYRVNRSALVDWSAAKLLRYVSSVTLCFEKRDTYRTS
jgi:SAM-dependent methyltransferase